MNNDLELLISAYLCAHACDASILDSQWWLSLAVKHTSLQKVGYGVVSHVDGGVWQGLNQPLLVPRQPRSYGNQGMHTHTHTRRRKKTKIIHFMTTDISSVLKQCFLVKLYTLVPNIEEM